MKHGYCALKRRENNSTITLWQCSREEYIILTNFHIRPTNVWRKYLKLTYKNHAQTAFVHCHSMKRLPLWSCECWKELQTFGLLYIYSQPTESTENEVECIGHTYPYQVELLQPQSNWKNQERFPYHLYKNKKFYPQEQQNGDKRKE